MNIILISHTEKPLETMYKIYSCLHAIHGTNINHLFDMSLRDGIPGTTKMCEYIQLCMEDDESPLEHCSFIFQIRNMYFENKDNYRKDAEEIKFMTINLRDLRYWYLKSQQTGAPKEEKELYRTIMFAIIDMVPFADYNLIK